ncbi:HNH endonuclease [Bacillus sp. AFS017274]|uniref:HNH endonuclease n=1 Tax=Bacillus sp. AFS017274 TaxID=2033488 RepID=UPI000BF627CF|nr:HNH endonuclease [Bacillus sp. AFS017274]PEZ76349.1 hypothetical protein CN380_21385 [Bacillus sp. AFS017274]
MIHIKRSPTPLDLLPNGISKGARETSVAITHYYINKSTDKFPNYKVYQEAKPELAIMFNDKCSYCESIISHTQAMHVEHYRPKAEIKGETQPKPGYYWLAADWDNLLLSCEKCNGQSHKGNHFPLKDPLKRVRDHTQDIKLEEPLLLNPCSHYPEMHLEFYENGEVKGITVEGEQSVITYGLRRRKLIDARARHYYEHIALKFTILEIMIKSLDDGSDDPNVINSIRLLVNSLEQQQRKNAQFAQMCRQVIKDKFLTLIPSLKRYYI